MSTPIQQGHTRTDTRVAERHFQLLETKLRQAVETIRTEDLTNVNVVNAENQGLKQPLGKEMLCGSWGTSRGIE